MHKRKATQEVQSAGWIQLIQDAEARIARAKSQIKRLEGVVRMGQRKLEAGERFPGEAVSQETKSA